MGEKKGFLFATIIFCCFFLPALIDWYAHSAKTDQVLKSATEFQQLVQEQGGYTSTVQNVKTTFENNGLKIKITKDKAGNNPYPMSDTRLEVGTEVYLHYEYERTPIFALRQDNRVVKTSNKVIINRR